MRPHTMICESCQQAIPNRATRGPLTAMDQPPRVFYRGMPLRLSRYEAQLLSLLIRFGRVGNEALVLVSTGEDVVDCVQSMQVVVGRVRKQLPAGIEIRPIRGWGYELAFDGR